MSKILRLTRQFGGIMLFVGAALISGCGAGNREPARENTKAGAVLLERSVEKMPQGFRDEGNWCNKHFQETVLVNVPPDNFNARYFRAPKGVFKVIITLGKTTSAFILEITGNPPLKLFTGSHFPQCLSAERNFVINTAGNGLKYDNQYYINFDLSVSIEDKGYLIRIDFPADMQYGIDVFRCSDCR